MLQERVSDQTRSCNCSQSDPKCMLELESSRANFQSEIGRAVGLLGIGGEAIAHIGRHILGKECLIYSDLR